ncbi:MAG: hypothetical protein P8Y24_07550 [Gammaproteobacteria bacterium]
MTDKHNEPLRNVPYHVETVEKISTPEGMPGNNWHRYVIARGNSTIDGIKPGTHKAVTEHAHAVARDLNERALKGKSYYAPSHRQNKKTN